MRRIAVGMTALLTVAGGCGDDEEAVTITASPAAVVQAVDDTLGASGRFRVLVTTTGDEGPTELEVVGAFDGAGRVELTADLGQLAPFAGGVLPVELQGELRVVLDADVAYVCGEVLAALGASCGSVDASAAGSLPIALDDPFGALRSLVAEAQSVEEVGQEDVDGTETTHLRGTITPAEALAALDEGDSAALEQQLGSLGVDDASLDQPFPFDVWIDGEGRVRRYHQETADGSGGLTVELRDLGTDVAIDVPSGDEVVALDALLSGLGG
jgi:hypothetical protein